MPTTRLALTRGISPALAHCELTHLSRVPIDLARARAQHAAYEATLSRLGWTVQRLPDIPEHPDGVFVEDTAIVLSELAVLTRPGAASRRGEVSSVEAALAPYRSLVHIKAPGTLDGGDVVVLGQKIYVGHTTRSNEAGIAQLRAHVAPFGYTVTSVPVTGCLHLKSAATAVARNTVLLNPAWVDPAIFEGCTVLHVDPAEPMAANAVWLGNAVLCAEAYPVTNARLRTHGLTVHTTPADELAKAEGALTCCSLLV